MTGAAQHQLARVIRAQVRHYAVEIQRKFGFGEKQFEYGQGSGGSGDFGGVFTQARGELTQGSMHLAQLFFVETDELVIEVDGFERLDKERLTAAAGSVDDAFDAALAPGHNRNYEAIVADGDEI